jgi:hypothetical protein
VQDIALHNYICTASAATSLHNCIVSMHGLNEIGDRVATGLHACCAAGEVPFCAGEGAQ